MVNAEEPLLKPGASFAGYRITASLFTDERSRIQVFSARRASELRLDALRVLHVQRAKRETTPEEIAEFAGAVERLKALRLPELPEVDGGGFSDGTFWIAVQDVRGQPLKEMIQERAIEDHWPIEACLRLVASIARVLKTAADHGILHLGVNPRSVYCTPDLELQTITGLGIPQLFKEKGPMLRHPDDVPYVAPEQIVRSLDVDPRTDVYAIGLLFFELCTLEVPFADNHGYLPGDFILKAILKLTPEPLKHRRPGTPDFIEAFMHRLVAKSGAQRLGLPHVITEAEEAAAEYERWSKRADKEELDPKKPTDEEQSPSQGALTTQQPATTPRPPQDPPPRRRLVPAIIPVAALCILMVALLAALFSDNGGETPSALGGRAVEQPAAVKPPAPPAVEPPALPAVKLPAPPAVEPPAPAAAALSAAVKPSAAERSLNSRTRQRGAPSAAPRSPSLRAIDAYYSFQSRRKEPLDDQD